MSALKNDFFNYLIAFSKIRFSIWPGKRLANNVDKDDPIGSLSRMLHVFQSN